MTGIPEEISHIRYIVRFIAQSPLSPVPSCNMCGSKGTYFLSKVRISFIARTSNLVKCRNCGLVYINPRFSTEQEKQVYAFLYHEAQEPAVWHEYRLPFFKAMLDKISSYNWSTHKALLDIGCAKGFFLDLARRAGWTVKGIDISRLAVAYGRQELGLDILEGELQDANLPDNSFDAVTSWNVLDQYYDPASMVQETYRILKKGGWSFFRVSNITFHLFLHRIFQGAQQFFPSLRNKSGPTVFHIYMFSPATIRKLLERVGFHDIRIMNSLLTPQVEAATKLTGRRLNYWFNSIIFRLAQLVFYLSLRQVVIGPSLVVMARK